MSEATANWEGRLYSFRESKLTRSAIARAERILARAERRESRPANRVLEPAAMDEMDNLAFMVAAIMIIAPLCAAFVGIMMNWQHDAFITR